MHPLWIVVHVKIPRANEISGKFIVSSDESVFGHTIKTLSAMYIRFG